MLKHLDISEEYGQADGYVVETSRDQIGNYLSEYTPQAEIIAEGLRLNSTQIAVLKHLRVHDDWQGNGCGNILLENFFEQVAREGGRGILLIADANESQRDGFVLADWYERWGFMLVTDTNAGPVMVFPEDLGEEIKRML